MSEATTETTTTTLHPCSKLLEMLRVLHTMGYQNLRAYWVMSPSGAYWRMNITSKDNIIGAATKEYTYSYRYSSSQGVNLDEIGDCTQLTPEDLAKQFLCMTKYDSGVWIQEMIQKGKGMDQVYADWYAAVVDQLKSWATIAHDGTLQYDVPYQVADWHYSHSVLNTLGSKVLPLPPMVLSPEEHAIHKQASGYAKSGMWNQLMELLDSSAAKQGCSGDGLVNCTNPEGRGTGYTLLHQAAWWGSEAAVTELKSRGASITNKTKDGLTPLDVAVKRFPKKESLHTLLQ
eukprot:PhF_6_TR8518/c1_g2_i2/m.13338